VALPAVTALLERFPDPDEVVGHGAVLRARTPTRGRDWRRIRPWGRGGRRVRSRARWWRRQQARLGVGEGEKLAGSHSTTIKRFGAAHTSGVRSCRGCSDGYRLRWRSADTPPQVTPWVLRYRLWPRHGQSRLRPDISSSCGRSPGIASGRGPRARRWHVWRRPGSAAPVPGSAA
jgi:hypothetical protein